jgi:hypothetical protein
VPTYYLVGTFSGLSNPRNGTLGKPRPLLGPFPAKPGLSLTEFRRFPSLAAARDYIALIQFFSGFPVKVSRDPAVKIVLGLQQQLRKTIKNRRKIRKMQN